MNNTKQSDTISILHNLRKTKEDKSSHAKTTMYVLLGIMLILMFTSMFTLNNWLIFSMFICFLWLSFTLKSLITFTEDRNNIDEFYLEQEMKKNQNVNQTKV